MENVLAEIDSDRRDQVRSRTAGHGMDFQPSEADFLKRHLPRALIGEGASDAGSSLKKGEQGEIGTTNLFITTNRSRGDLPRFYPICLGRRRHFARLGFE
jgi:hypothetical protein